MNISKAIDNASNALGNSIKWPDSEGTKKELELAIKVLRKVFKEDGYPDLFRYMATVQIASNLWNEVANRDAKFCNFKQAWIKLGDLLND